MAGRLAVTVLRLCGFALGVVAVCLGIVVLPLLLTFCIVARTFDKSLGVGRLVAITPVNPNIQQRFKESGLSLPNVLKMRDAITACTVLLVALLPRVSPI